MSRKSGFLGTSPRTLSTNSAVGSVGPAVLCVFTGVIGVIRTRYARHTGNLATRQQILNLGVRIIRRAGLTHGKTEMYGFFGTRRFAVNRL